MGEGLEAYEYEPRLDGDGVVWKDPVTTSRWPEVLAPVTDPFDNEGGMRQIRGNLGRGIVKISAVKPEHRHVKAPCRVFSDQESFKLAFDAGELERDLVAVVRFQGPKACGMPELHQLTPYLGVLQDRGYQVALVTDGRMSGASGKVPTAIHMSPEALAGGPLAKLRDGDVIELDAAKGKLNVELDADEFAAREAVVHAHANDTLGRGLFASMRDAVAGFRVGRINFPF